MNGFSSFQFAVFVPSVIMGLGRVGLPGGVILWSEQPTACTSCNTLLGKRKFISSFIGMLEIEDSYVEMDTIINKMKD